MKLTKSHLIKLLSVVEFFTSCLLVHMILGYRLKVGYVLTVFPIFLLLSYFYKIYRVLPISLSIVTLIYVSTVLVYDQPNFNFTFYSYREFSRYQSALGVI